MSETAKTTLHVFRNDAIEWLVAASPEDAAAVALVEFGPDAIGCDADDWDQEPDDKLLPIYQDESCSEAHRIFKTCAEWAALNGRGFLCSTEF